jgi:type I restriction enzyme, S subunit
MKTALTPGYKQTEVGLIPEGWRTCDISDLCGLQRGFDITEATRESGDVPVYSSSGLSYFHNQAKLVPPSVITGRKGLLGKVFYVEEPCWPHDTTLWVKDFKRNDPRFVYWFLIHFRLERFDAATSVPTLNRNNVIGVPIALPPLFEQRAIAEALSDADALIASLEQLIAKKRQVKQGAMQELLHRRDGWGERYVAEIADCLDNLRIPLNDLQRSKMKGDYPYCGANGILDYINDYCVDDSVILMAEDGGYFDEYMTRPIAYRMSGKFWVNNHAHVLKSKAESDQDFLFYSLVHKNILSFLASGTRAKLNKSELNKIVIHLPATKPEQTAIAAILSDMDAEIAALEAKLVKARQVKQGMMQELLTGRIRLV